MARVFSRVRGAFRAMDVGNIVPSIIKIDELKLPQDGALVSNFSFSKNEKTSIIQCFKDVNHIYAFGHDPEGSMFSITYIVFMTDKCAEEFKDSGRLQTMINGYNDLRVSARKATIKATFGTGVVLVGILTNVQTAVFEAETNTLTVTFSGKNVSNP